MMWSGRGEGIFMRYLFTKESGIFIALTALVISEESELQETI